MTASLRILLPRPILTALLLVLLGAAGCSPSPSDGVTETAGTTNYPARGVIRDFTTDGRSVVIRHEEIPGYMPRMTMSLLVRDTNELRGLREGDEVTFRLHVTAEDHFIDRLVKVGSTNIGPSPATPAASGGDLKNGDVLPDFAFLAEDGRTARLSEFRGRAVAFTFIFTTCPLPDFCPRMSRNFARARAILLSRTNAPAGWNLLSLSFDPEHDSPAVLERYARGHRGENPDRWLFGVLDTNTLETLAPRVNFLFGREKGGGLAHNLRTVVVGPDGRIRRQFDGNHWTPEELADAVVEAASGVRD
jgi:protein SCO1/2